MPDDELSTELLILIDYVKKENKITSVAHAADFFFNMTGVVMRETEKTSKTQ